MLTNKQPTSKKSHFFDKINGKFYFKKGIYSFLNPYSAGVALKNEETFNKLNGIYIDGIVLLKLLNIFKFNLENRISFDFTSIANDVFKIAQDQKYSISIIGSTEIDIESFVEEIKNSFNGINVIYYRSGFFLDQNERTAALNHIKSINPDIVICGMGTPKQEEFLVDLKTTGWCGYGFTCGGFIHQTARTKNKKKSYYPAIFNKLHLRALYRMWDEPKLIKRYFYQYPLSIIKIVDHLKTRNMK